MSMRLPSRDTKESCGREEWTGRWTLELAQIWFYNCDTEHVIKEMHAGWEKKRIMDWTPRHHNNKGSGRGKDWEGATNEIREKPRGYGVLEVKWRTYIWERNDKLWHMLLTGQGRWGLRLDHWVYLYENERKGWGDGLMGIGLRENGTEQKNLRKE